MSRWLYSLTAREEGICAEIGYLRQKPYLGDPSKNNNYSEGDVWEMWQHSIAAGAELALARMMGLNNFIPHVNKFKSSLDVPEFGEVRYSFNPNNGLRISKRDHASVKYVLLTDGLAIKNRTNKGEKRASTPYRAIGWIWGYEAMNHKFLNANQTGWYVEQAYLHDMNII